MKSKSNGAGAGPNGHANGRTNGHANGHANGHGRKPLTLITGGAGFIGSNLAHRLLGEGRRVLLYDNLSRPGVRANYAWLRQEHGERVELLVADTRDPETLREAVAQASHVFHFAAQVAVTTSVENPREDLEINVLGTFNLLEAIRAQRRPPSLVFTSTNKVYGELGDIRLREGAARYAPVDPELRKHGVSERRPLDFHSPYGCSKGAADQYIIDYARIYGIPTAVFRMSCIYGPHQFGTEDQGWVAHFLIRAMHDEPITIYGDGKQVRDILFVEDLAEAFVLAEANIERIGGQAFNIGGGPGCTISLVELMDEIEALEGRRPRVVSGGWRPGDQKYYVSNTTKFSRATGWRARVGAREGIARLHQWLRQARGLDFASHLKPEELMHGDHPRPVKNGGGHTTLAA